MPVQSREEGDVLIAYITEKQIVDPNLIQEIGSQLVDTVVRCSKPRVLLNLKGVELMSTELIGKIVSLSKKCRDTNVDFRICEIAPKFMKVIKVMMLHKVLNIHKTEEKALASF